MLMHSDLMLDIAAQRHRELVADSERRQLLTIARAAREARRARKHAAVRGRPAGSLASCEPSAAAPAR